MCFLTLLLYFKSSPKIRFRRLIASDVTLPRLFATLPRFGIFCPVVGRFLKKRSNSLGPIIRDRHILKNDLKKCGTGDPLNFLNFFAKIVFLVLLYTTVTKFL